MRAHREGIHNSVHWKVRKERETRQGKVGVQKDGACLPSLLLGSQFQKAQAAKSYGTKSVLLNCIMEQ